METTSRSDAPPQPNARATHREAVADPASTGTAPESGSGLLPYLPVPRHRRPTDAELADGGRFANATFVRTTIVFTVLFVMAMTALIWYRWYPVALPTSNIVFTGDESLDGAVATLTRNGQDAGSVTIRKEDNFIGTIWLSPGRYDLVVSKNDRIIQNVKLVVSPGQSLMDTLAAIPPSAPATASKPTTSP